MDNARTFSIGDFDPVTRSFPVVASTRNPVKGWYWDETKKEMLPRWEALESWDLRRFAKNPLILAVHDQNNIKSIIGKASDVQETDRGLEMTITLASLYDEPATEEIERKLKAGLLRGVSVGFSYGPETKLADRGGLPYSTFANNELNEVSLVPVPADEDALIDSEETRAAKEAEAKRGLGYMEPCDDDKKRAELSEAGKKLAGARLPKVDGKDKQARKERVQRFDQLATVGRTERTQVGGIRVAARLTRTGILKYRLPNGEVRSEYRPAEEVFHADSLETLRGAPVVEYEHHTKAAGMVSAENYRERARGHVEAVRHDSKYVEAELVIQDAGVVDGIEGGRLRDISCGYTSLLDFTPGTFEGEHYDCVQRDITYNHVAVLERGRGRAGTDVGIRLDSNDALCVEESEEHTMAEPQKRVIRIDGADFEYGSELHIGKIESLHQAEITKVRGELTSLKSQYDVLQGKFDAAETEAKEAKAEAEKAKKSDGETIKARIKQRMRLLRKYLRFLSDDEDEEGDDAEAKMDALDDLSDRDVMIKCLNATEAFKDQKFDGKSDDYVLGLFEHTLKNAKPAGGVDDVMRAHKDALKQSRLDAEDPVVKAEIERQKKLAEKPAWQQPLAMSKS